MGLLSFCVIGLYKIRFSVIYIDDWNRHYAVGRSVAYLLRFYDAKQWCDTIRARKVSVRQSVKHLFRIVLYKIVLRDTIVRCSVLEQSSCVTKFHVPLKDGLTHNSVALHSFGVSYLFPCHATSAMHFLSLAKLLFSWCHTISRIYMGFRKSWDLSKDPRWILRLVQAMITYQYRIPENMTICNPATVQIINSCSAEMDCG